MERIMDNSNSNLSILFQYYYDEAPAFQSISLQEYFKALNIQPIYISPMNHGSNRSELDT